MARTKAHDRAGIQTYKCFTCKRIMKKQGCDDKIKNCARCVRRKREAKEKAKRLKEYDKERKRREAKN